MVTCLLVASSVLRGQKLAVKNTVYTKAAIAVIQYVAIIRPFYNVNKIMHIHTCT
jgi:hypothetical protein